MNNDKRFIEIRFCIMTISYPSKIDLLSIRKGYRLGYPHSCDFAFQGISKIGRYYMPYVLFGNINNAGDKF